MKYPSRQNLYDWLKANPRGKMDIRNSTCCLGSKFLSDFYGKEVDCALHTFGFTSDFMMKGPCYTSRKWLGDLIDYLWMRSFGGRKSNYTRKEVLVAWLEFDPQARKLFS